MSPRKNRLGKQKPSLKKSKAIEDDDVSSGEEYGMGGPTSAFQPVPKERGKEVRVYAPTGGLEMIRMIVSQCQSKSAHRNVSVCNVALYK